MIHFRQHLSWNILGSVVFIFFLSCTTGEQQMTPVDQIVVRLSGEPETLSPILAQTSLAREAYQYVFLNLANYDYETLELKPILIESIPNEEIIQDGPQKGLLALKMKIRDEAKWSDGTDVTGEDVLVTYKIVFHPGVHTPGWKSFFQPIREIVIDSENPKVFTVYSEDSHFLNKEAILSTEIYQKNLFDPTGVLNEVSLDDLRNPERTEELKKIEAFNKFGEEFSSVKYSKELADGSGPYQLESWETGQYLVLKKKENYWGSKFPELDQLETYPDRIVLQFLTDESTALTLLKNDEIDVIDLTRSSYKQFDDLKEDAEVAARFNFETTQLPRFYYLLMNNDDVRLSDISVRKAIAHLVDVDRMIRQIEGGYARRANTFIHFSKPEYNKSLGFIDYNVNKAKDLLEQAGWEDSDGDKIRDKIIQGRKVSLTLRFHISESNLSSSVSAIIKEACEQAGIEIEIIIKPNRAVRTDNLIPGDFELFIRQITQSPVKYDPFNNYHSTAIGTSGTNYSRYSNPEADRYIDIIRESKDEAERYEAYQELQRIVTDDVPEVFLYTPELRLVIDKGITPVISSKRPGYFVNAVKE